MSKYNAAYINALSEEHNPKILFEWILTLHRENVDLKDYIKAQEYLIKFNKEKDE